MAIFNNQFLPGEWIRQKKIAEEMGVSQMPVREALKELAKDGIVEHIPYRGVRVMQFSYEDIADLFAQRACLESIATRAAADVINDQELAVLKGINTQMEANLAHDQNLQNRQLNREFHQAIYRTSAREYLIRTLDQVWQIYPIMLFGHLSKTFQQPLANINSNDILEHQAIIAALENRNPQAAEEAVRTHIGNTWQDLLKMMESNL
jgi:DNA-binding GntR family transcriptional regulator